MVVLLVCGFFGTTHGSVLYICVCVCVCACGDQPCEGLCSFFLVVFIRKGLCINIRRSRFVYRVMDDRDRGIYVYIHIVSCFAGHLFYVQDSFLSFFFFFFQELLLEK